MDNRADALYTFKTSISSCGPCVRMLTKPRRWQSRAVSCIHHAVSVYHSFGNSGTYHYIALFICQHSSKIPITTFLKQSKNPRQWLKC